MERPSVTSSNINSIGYDADSQILEIEFDNGSVYEYSGVPEGEHTGLMNADSKGTYFNANIKNRYPFSKGAVRVDCGHGGHVIANLSNDAGPAPTWAFRSSARNHPR